MHFRFTEKGCVKNLTTNFGQYRNFTKNKKNNKTWLILVKSYNHN